jgi:hypothetical protein
MNTPSSGSCRRILKAAEAAAAAQFELNDEQRKRVAVQEVDAS